MDAGRLYFATEIHDKEGKLQAGRGTSLFLEARPEDVKGTTAYSREVARRKALYITAIGYHSDLPNCSLNFVM